MAIRPITGFPASGMTLRPMPPCASCPVWHDSDEECGWPDCTPPAENSNPSGASDGADGQGVCIPKRSNLDSTRRRIVKKGCVVRFPGGATARVSRVRCGLFYTVLMPATGSVARYHACSEVEVIA